MKRWTHSLIWKQAGTLRCQRPHPNAELWSLHPLLSIPCYQLSQPSSTTWYVIVKHYSLYKSEVDSGVRFMCESRWLSPRWVQCSVFSVCFAFVFVSKAYVSSYLSTSSSLARSSAINSCVVIRLRFHTVHLTASTSSSSFLDSFPPVHIEYYASCFQPSHGSIARSEQSEKIPLASPDSRKGLLQSPT